MEGRPYRPLWPSFLLAAGDAVTLGFCFWLGRLSHAWYYHQNSWDVLLYWWGKVYSANLVLFPLMACVAVLWFYFRGHYARQKAFWDELGEIIQVVVVLAGLNATFAFSGHLPLSRLWLFSTWILVLMLMPLVRAGVRFLISRRTSWLQPYVLLGCGPNAAEAARAFASEPTRGYRLHSVLQVDPADDVHPDLPAGVQRVALGPDPLCTLKRLGKPHVVLALEADQWPVLNSLVLELGMNYPDLSIAPPLRGLPIFGMQTLHFFSHEVFILRAQDNLARPGSRIVKRIFDLLVASLLLVLLSPLFLFLVWRIRAEDDGPAFFLQERVGYAGRPFACHKFRSMVINAERQLQEYLQAHPEKQAEYQRNFKLRQDPRVTRIGRFLRRGSLDELPQLFNVLRGEMSLVGPRPLLAGELERYGSGISLYRQVRPGITGLWQTSGRSETTFADRASLDAWYVKNWSLWYDIVILFRTIKVVFLKSGAY